MFPLHVLLTDIEFENLRYEELFSADVVRKMLQHIQSLVHTRTLPPHLPGQRGLEEDEADPEEDLDALAEEHVPDAEDGGPGQRPREDAEEPLGHVEDWLHALGLEVAVDPGGDPLQQPEQDVPVKLDGLHAGTGKLKNHQNLVFKMNYCQVLVTSPVPKTQSQA